MTTYKYQSMHRDVLSDVETSASASARYHELLSKGYRWIRTDGNRAIFELMENSCSSFPLAGTPGVTFHGDVSIPPKAAPRSRPVIWPNGCDKSAPAALRFLAHHPRPEGLGKTYDRKHLYQITEEIEEAAIRTAELERDLAQCDPERTGEKLMEAKIEIRKLKGEAADLEKQLEERKSANASLKETVIEEAGRNRKLSIEINDLKAVLGEARRMRDDTKKDNESLAEELRKMTEFRNNAANHCEELKRRVEADSRISSIESGCMSSVLAERNELKLKLAEMTQFRDNAMNHNAELVRKVEGMELTLSSARVNAEALCEERDTALSQLECSEGKERALRIKIEGMTKEISAQQKNRDNDALRIKALEVDLKCACTTREDYSRAIDGWREKSERDDKKIAELARELAEMTQSRDNACREHNKARGDLGDCQECAARYLKERDETLKELTFYREMMSYLIPHLGQDIFVEDDGSIVDHALMRKIPGLTLAIFQRNKNTISEQSHLIDSRNRELDEAKAALGAMMQERDTARTFWGDETNKLRESEAAANRLRASVRKFKTALEEL